MSLTGEELYDIWAPPDSHWSVWAKPVLFAGMARSAYADIASELPSVAGIPRPRDSAVVVDVAGSDSVRIGLALAGAGYRPVPLYNAGTAPGMLVNMRVIADFLGMGAKPLSDSKLPQDAPPAFLLNQDRLDNARDAAKAGRYDNRWCVVPQDMPSGEYLRDHGIRQVVLIANQVMDDLSHVLRRYQDAGLAIWRSADPALAAQAITVAQPPLYRYLLYRFQAYAGLRRNSAGGFGAVVPDPNQSGGFG